jgi:hypothetical protein
VARAAFHRAWDFDPDRDEGVLALVREDGRADLIAAHRLIDLLRQARPMPGWWF